jgi:hypothetical protein
MVPIHDPETYSESTQKSDAIAAYFSNLCFVVVVFYIFISTPLCHKYNIHISCNFNPLKPSDYYIYHLL